MKNNIFLKDYSGENHFKNIYERITGALKNIDCLYDLYEKYNDSKIDNESKSDINSSIINCILNSQSCLNMGLLSINDSVEWVKNFYEVTIKRLSLEPVYDFLDNYFIKNNNFDNIFLLLKNNDKKISDIFNEISEKIFTNIFNFVIHFNTIMIINNLSIEKVSEVKYKNERLYELVESFFENIYKLSELNNYNVSDKIHNISIVLDIIINKFFEYIIENISKYNEIKRIREKLDKIFRKDKNDILEDLKDYANRKGIPINKDLIKKIYDKFDGIIMYKTLNTGDLIPFLVYLKIINSDPNNYASLSLEIKYKKDNKDVGSEFDLLLYNVEREVLLDLEFTLDVEKNVEKKIERFSNIAGRDYYLIVVDLRDKKSHYKEKGYSVVPLKNFISDFSLDEIF